jgi:hypothetical protein
VTIAREIKAIGIDRQCIPGRGTDDTTCLHGGTRVMVCPALYRFERQCLTRSKWRITDDNLGARDYALTLRDGGISAMNSHGGHRASRAINLMPEATIACP